MFTSRTVNLVDPRDFQRDFKNLLKKNGIRDVNVHGLRHTFATRALESGMSVKTLSKIFGHSNVGFTIPVPNSNTKTHAVHTDNNNQYHSDKW